MRTRTCFLAWLTATVLAGGARAATPAAAPELPAGLRLADATVIENLALPSGLPAAFDVTLDLDGVAETVHLVRHAVRDAGFRVRVSTGVDDPPPPARTYRGIFGPGRVAASLTADGLRATIVRGDTVWAVQPLPSGAHVVYEHTAILPGPGACAGASEGRPAPARAGATPAEETGTPAIALIAFDADFEYVTLHGGSVASVVADIESVLNGVNLIFETQLGITHRITEIVARTAEPDPYTSHDPETLLEQLRDHWNADPDTVRVVTHLMTGRDLDGDVVGHAYLGPICLRPLDAYGLSQSRYTENFLSRIQLTAHELGHGWGAEHCWDACDEPGAADCGIMCPCIGGCSGEQGLFGGDALADMTHQLDYSVCLGIDGPVAARLHVDAAAPDGGDGLTWATAHRRLDTALGIAAGSSIPDTIWVAGGTYVPDPARVRLPRTATFAVRPGLAVYGGFTGGERDLAARNWDANPTILSADLPGADGYSAVTAFAGPPTLVDGFHVRGGHANAVTPLDSSVRGAGVYSYGGILCLRNVVVTSNVAWLGGGGVAADGGTLVMLDCLVHDNHSTAPNVGGGGITTIDGVTSIVNCTVTANTAGESIGEGMRGYGAGDVTIRNTILWANGGPGQVAQLHVFGTLAADACCIEGLDGSLGGVGNIGADPRLDAAFALSPGSPCIDAGDNGSVRPGLDLDLRHAPRFVDDPCTTDTGRGPSPIVDMGAIESPGAAPAADTNGDGTVDVGDLNNVILDWGTDGAAHGGDLAGVTPGSGPDGVVNVNDLNAVVTGWGESCPR